MRLNRTIFQYLLLPFALMLAQPALASSDLALKKVTENVYAIVGELSNRSPQNLGNNATFGVVVTAKGVVLIDSGATYKGAERIHNLIKTVTDQAVVYVINSGGQDHRFLGNGYFKSQGAQIIASAKAVQDHKARLNDQFLRLESLVGAEGVKGTDAVYADITFDQKYELKVGDTHFDIIHAGQAHTPGDSFIWLPKQKVIFTGDIVYTERMLGVGTQSNSKSWITAFEAMRNLRPEYLVPGHGKPTDLATAEKDTYSYLKFLRESVADFIDNDGDISEISKIDQSAYKYLYNYDSLSGRNAQQVFTEIEFE